MSGGLSNNATLQFVPFYSTDAGASWNAFGGPSFASGGTAANVAAYQGTVVNIPASGRHDLPVCGGGHQDRR